MVDLRALIEDEIPHLRRYARVLTRDMHRADDLVQDCLERAWKRLRLWRPGSNVRGWLFTILHNLHANEARRFSHAPTLVSLEEVLELLHTTASAEIGSDADDVLAAVEKLPPEQHEVLLLVAVEGMSYKEVAKVLNVPIGTVMSRLHRGRAQLARSLTANRGATIRSVR